ncbi:PAS domain-containing sensor histidine kinase [Microcoleus vaginatus PCC 9802]|uniref:PAS domain-containing sensor histidine kinase n=1 Tax=Microcoleus vaginatus TaxID=119532 RepID=UPI00020D198D|nr:PAS/PAC sensor signal transduction histidine kinase [Microcoleus vaginatus FGP-2]UNU20083.1 PAS domain-containing sensor histidine kinase [Microcoleus vaginatus PCC 9802]
MTTDSFHLSLLERAIAASSNSILIADASRPDIPIIYCNPAFEKLTGYSAEEVIGRNCRFLQGPDTDQAELDKLRSSLRAGTEIQVVLKNYRKDKTPFWNELIVSPILDNEGKLTHFIGVQNDISKRVAAETALQESEERLRAIATVTPVPMSITRLEDSVILYANPALGKSLGVSSEQLIGRKKIELYANINDRRQLIELVKQNGFSDSEQICLRKPNGSLFWVKMSMRSINFNGEAAILSAFYDITARVEAETALRQSEARFQKLAANVPGMIYQFQLAADGTLSFPYVSSGCRELWELEPEVLQDSAIPAIEMIHPEDAPSFHESVAISAKTLEPWRWEGRFVFPGDRIKWISGASRPEPGEKADIIWDGLLIDISDRKLAESALRQSEARFQKMAANVPGMIYQYLLHPDGSDEFIYASSGCWELYELEPEKIQENSGLMWSMVHPEDLKSMLESIAISGETLKPWIYEGRIVTGSGKVKWIRGIARPELQPGGDILWEGVTIDISDRKLAEIALSESKMALQQANQELEKRVLERTEALQTSQNMLWSVINNIPQLIAWKDRDLVYLGGNKNFAKVAGFNHPSEIAGLTDFDMPWKPEETEIFRACDRRIMATNTPEYHIIESKMQADGTQCCLDTNKIPLHDNSGNVVGILSTFEDITDRLSLAAQVRASEELFRTIFEDAPIAIYLANLDDNKLVRVNKTYCEMLGYTAEELLNKTFTELGHPEDYPNNLQVAHSLERGETNSYQIEIRQLAATGKIVWVNVTATLIRDAEGKAIYKLGMIENITNRKISAAALQASESQLRKQASQLQEAYEQLQNAQIQLVQSEKMSSLGQMVAGIAHEINNPATFINGNISHTYNYFHDLIELLSLYQECYPSPVPQIAEKVKDLELDFLKEDLPRMLNSMRVGIERISKIVLSLRNFSRLDESEMKLVDLHEGIDSTLLILQHRLHQGSRKSRIEIIKEYGKISKIHCCAGQLNQVFLNIISNAIDALENQPQPRTIVIRTLMKKAGLKSHSKNQLTDCDRIVICIADSGPGMSEDVRKRLFDPFFTTKPVGAGTGLGLSISHQIVVEKHKGSLRCISAPGQGAEFWIEIPC